MTGVRFEELTGVNSLKNRLFKVWLLFLLCYFPFFPPIGFLCLILVRDSRGKMLHLIYDRRSNTPTWACELFNQNRFYSGVLHVLISRGVISVEENTGFLNIYCRLGEHRRFIGSTEYRKRGSAVCGRNKMNQPLFFNLKRGRNWADPQLLFGTMSLEWLPRSWQWQ
jgi:hypothetical protein